MLYRFGGLPVILNKFLILQKKAVRLMTNNDNIPTLSTPLTSSDPIFKNLKILKIEDVFKFHVSKFVYS